jgi:hypothetical protein
MLKKYAQNVKKIKSLTLMGQAFVQATVGSAHSQRSEMEC